MERPEISVVVPVYNEEENLSELHRRLRVVLEKDLQVTYEIIFIDDGSKDNSWEIIEKLHNQNGNIKGVKFSRNFGHHIAVTAGINNVSGEVTIVMDADLQARPEDIPKAFEEYKKGCDVIWAVAIERQDGVVARFGAKLFYALFNKLANINIPENIVFLTFSMKAVDAIRAFGEKRRILAGIYSDIGFKARTIVVKKDKRFAGTVKYNLKKRLLLAVTGTISYSKIPLRISSYLGFIISVCSMIFTLIVFIRKLFFDISVSGYASLIIAITFIGGVQLMILGILGEYIGVVVDEVKNRPNYIVEKKLMQVQS
jgi:dolichol-phosphate mannosyltransferase